MFTWRGPAAGRAEGEGEAPWPRPPGEGREGEVPWAQHDKVEVAAVAGPLLSCRCRLNLCFLFSQSSFQVSCNFILINPIISITDH
jgi:hypothetical protein